MYPSIRSSFYNIVFLSVLSYIFTSYIFILHLTLSNGYSIISLYSFLHLSVLFLQFYPFAYLYFFLRSTCYLYCLFKSLSLHTSDFQFLFRLSTPLFVVYLHNYRSFRLAICVVYLYLYLRLNSFFFLFLISVQFNPTFCSFFDHLSVQLSIIFFVPVPLYPLHLYAP